MGRKVDIKTFKRSYKFICEKCGRFSRIKREYCRICGLFLRKATKNDYKKIAERMMNENLQMMNGEKEFLQTRAKMRGMLDEQIIILQDLTKNDEEHKELLKRKTSGESIENLIIKNRARQEILEKELKEKREIALKWGRSEKGREMFKKMDIIAKLNPKPVMKLII